MKLNAWKLTENYGIISHNCKFFKGQPISWKTWRRWNCELPWVSI